MWRIPPAVEFAVILAMRPILTQAVPAAKIKEARKTILKMIWERWTTCKRRVSGKPRASNSVEKR